MPEVLPVALTLEGRRCLVVGGGRVAARRVRDLVAARGSVHVVAPTLDAGIHELVRAGRATWREGRFEERDLDGAHLVVVATGDVAVNEHAYAAADRRGLWINCADDPARCTFFFTALVRRDPVVVSVTTSGRSPALAAFLRRRLDAQLEPELGRVARILGDVRDELHADGLTTEGLAWESVVDDRLVALVAAGDAGIARARVRDAVRGPVDPS